MRAADRSLQPLNQQRLRADGAPRHDLVQEPSRGSSFATLRQQTASDLHTVHPRWIDTSGPKPVSRAATTHPNYKVVRHLLVIASALVAWGETNLISPEWLALDGCPKQLGCECQIAYAIADEIGMKPHAYARLETLHASDQFADDTILWTYSQWSGKSGAMRALRQRALAGDPAARAALWAKDNPPSQRDAYRARVHEYAAQRGFRSCDCLPDAFECELHTAERRASDISETEAPLLAEEATA